jgi:hypothetical protein
MIIEVVIEIGSEMGYGGRGRQAGGPVKKCTSLGFLEVVPLLGVHEFAALGEVALGHHLLLLLVHLALDRQ